MRAVKVALLMTLSVVCLTSVAWAQGTDTGSLRGRITDSTGAALPGVTVTAASDAVMGGKLVAVTSDEGLYRFPSLPPGIYDIRMELQGFQPIRVPNVRINVGLGLTIDKVLAVANVQESVTVIGDSPIVDTKNTAAGAIVTLDVLQKVPSSRDLWNTMQQVPGLVVARENVGGFESHTLSTMSVHGSGASAVQHNINGVDMTLMHQDNLGAGYFSTDSYEEIEVTTSGISAENSRGGLIINQVFKSGGNQFHGSASTFYEGDNLQSDNLDDALRKRGVTTNGAPLDSLYDFNAQLGGPIIKDRIWFFNAVRNYRITPFVLNCFLPDGSQCTNESTLQNYDLKLSGQANPNNRMSFLYAWGRKYLPNRDISQFIKPEASYKQDGRHIVYQGKYDRILAANAVLETAYGQLATPFPLAYRDSTGDKTTAFDETTQIRYDAPFQDFFQRGFMRTIGGKLSYFEDNLFGAAHDLKFGIEFRQGKVPQTTARNGDLERRYQSGVPFRVIAYNTPVTNDAHNYNVSGFAQDSLRRGRVTINPGVRVEWWRGDLPAQSNTPGTFAAIFGANTYPAQKGLMGWTTVSPRVGIVYDVTGNSKTVVKATYGRYFNQIEGNRINNTANRNQISSATYNWTDFNGNNYPDYPTEFVSRVSLSIPQARTITPGLKSPYSDEVSATIERGLTQRMSISARYTYRKNNRILAETNLALPDSAFSIPSTATDPLTGQPISFWSLGPAYRTVVNDIVLTQFDENYTRYHGIDIVFDRRFDGRWLFRGSLTFQDNFGRVGGFSNRNDKEIFPYGAVGLDPHYMVKLLGTYVLPWNVNFGWAFRSTGGMNSFTGGSAMARLVQVRDVTTNSAYQIRVEENGAYRQDHVTVTDLRASKVFRFGRRSIEAMVDVFNLFNANNVVQAGVITGSTFDVPSAILPPRVARFGLRFEF